MYFGPVSLSDATAAELKFKLWANTEKDVDYFRWLVSLDDDTYYGYRGSGNTFGWFDQSFDLSAWPGLGNLLGQPQIWIAFAFSSDASVNWPEGALVDDVVLRKCVGGGCSGGAPTAQAHGFQFEAVPGTMERPR
jgi:hypothetical protein